jgi:hypothetical protein
VRVVFPLVSSNGIRLCRNPKGLHNFQAPSATSERVIQLDIAMWNCVTLKGKEANEGFRVVK